MINRLSKWWWERRHRSVDVPFQGSVVKVIHSRRWRDFFRAADIS